MQSTTKPPFKRSPMKQARYELDKTTVETYGLGFAATTKDVKGYSVATAILAFICGYAVCAVLPISRLSALSLKFAEYAPLLSWQLNTQGPHITEYAYGQGQARASTHRDRGPAHPIFSINLSRSFLFRFTANGSDRYIFASSIEDCNDPETRPLSLGCLQETAPREPDETVSPNTMQTHWNAALTPRLDAGQLETTLPSPMNICRRSSNSTQIDETSVDTHSSIESSKKVPSIDENVNSFDPLQGRTGVPLTHSTAVDWLPAEAVNRRRARPRNDDSSESHIPQKHHYCPVPSCGRLFISHHDLKCHLLTHPQERLNACPDCSRPFFSTDAVPWHRRIHECWVTTDMPLDDIFDEYHDQGYVSGTHGQEISATSTHDTSSFGPGAVVTDNNNEYLPVYEDKAVGEKPASRTRLSRKSLTKAPKIVESILRNCEKSPICD